MNKRAFFILLLAALLSSALFAGWSEMQRLTYRGNEINPQVVARNDTVHVMWSQALSAGQISYIRSTDNGLTWGNIINLSESGHTGHYPSMAVTSSAIWVCWADNNLESIAITSSINGAFWNRPTYKYTIDSQRWSKPSMAVNSDTIFLVYLAETPDSTGLMPFKFLRSSDGGHAWSDLITFAHATSGILAMELNYCQGSLLFAITSAPDTALGGYHIIGYISTTAGQTWSDTMWISPRQWHTAQQPCISCSQTTGQFAVGYMDYRYQQYAFYGDIFIRLSVSDTTHWGYEGQATNNHTAVSPSIYYNNNALGAAWSDRKYYDEYRDEIFFNCSENNGITWQGEQRLTNTYSWSYSPWVYNNNDTIQVVWYEHDTSGGYGSDIFYMKYTPDTSDIIESDNIAPSAFSLSAYPNPFNSTVSININSEDNGTIYISDILGRFVTELKYTKGITTMKWDATDKNGKLLPSGAYFIKNKGGGYKDVLKVMYLK